MAFKATFQPYQATLIQVGMLIAEFPLTQHCLVTICSCNQDKWRIGKHDD